MTSRITQGIIKIAPTTKMPITSFTGPHQFLSNFSPAPVYLDGELYPTVEHAYQAAKTRDTRERKAIRLLISPGAAKRAGRSITIRGDWESRRLKIMRVLLAQKFRFAKTQGLTEDAKALLKTDEEELIEENTWDDIFWGVCKGIGKNHLGRLLMDRRKELRVL